MSTWFTSDTHFSHKNIIKYQPNTRGHIDSVQEMDAILISNWNALVSPNDTVYHLGDFAFTNQKAIYHILGSLNGKIHLITGNHDKAFGNEGFRTNLIESGLIAKFYRTYHEVRIDKMFFVLNHYAQRVWNRSHYGTIHLYGHSHGSLPGEGKSVDVGVDSIELAEFTGRTLSPWSLNEILDYMERRPVGEVDHHVVRKSKRQR